MARTGFSSVAMPDGSIVLMGGSWNYSVGNKNAVWRSTDNGATWMLVNASAGWSARSAHSIVAMPDGSIVLMGGIDGSGEKNDTWRSTDYGATWTQMTGSAEWSARYSHTSVAMPDGSIVLMGGRGYSLKNDVWRSTDNGATWTQMSAYAGWSGRAAHSTVAMPDGSIVLTGGWAASREKNDTWRSTDGGNVWTLMNASAGWSARSAHSIVAMPDGSIVLMGGIDGSGEKNDTWRSTNNGVTWTRMNASAGWTARFFHSSVAMPDGSIVLMGGYDNSYNLKNDVWRFIPAAGSSAQNPSHTYTIPGIYTVALQAYNAGGYNSTRKISYITVTALPAVSFTGTPTSGTAPLTVSFTDTSTGTPNTWNWSFGDNSTSTAQNPIHIYSIPGNYSVSLTIMNPDGSNATVRTDYISVTPPPTRIFFSNPVSVIFKDSITDLDILVDHLPRGLAGYTITISLSNPDIAEITDVTFPSWAMLNHTSTLPSRSLTIGGLDLDEQVQNWSVNISLGKISIRGINDGLTNVVLTALQMDADGGGAIQPTVSNAQIEIGTPPKADFWANLTGGEPPLPVFFYDNTTFSSLNSSVMDFGDGTTSTNWSNRVHIYSEPGDYTVTLTVTTKFGNDSLIKSNYIHVGRMPTIHITPPNNPLSVDSQDTLTLSIDELPLGLAGYNITILLTNESVAKIVDIQFPGWAKLSSHSGLPNTTVSMSAADLDEQINPGDTNVTLGTITIQATNPGLAHLSIKVQQMDADNGTAIYPNLASVMMTVSPPQPFPGYLSIPTDPDFDGKFEDVNGNGRKDFDDVVVYYKKMIWISGNEPISLFDFNGNGRIDFDDVVRLYKEI